MPDNLDLGADAQINHVIAGLRGTPAEGAAANMARPGPGCFLSIDPDARIEGTFRTGNGTVMDLDYRALTPPRWIALHLDMGGASFAGRAVAGIVLRSSAPSAVALRLCLRSGDGTDFTDCFFDKHVAAHARTSTHVDLLRLEDHAARIPDTCARRELVLFLPPRDARIVVQDLRVFVV